MFSISTASASLVPWTDSSAKRGRIDLTKDQAASAIVLFALHQVYDLDFEKVEISANLTDDYASRNAGVIFSLYEGADDVIWTSFSRHGLDFAGRVCVRAKAGEDIRKAPRKNPGEDLAKFWNERRGFPADYPASVEVQLTPEGGLEISVQPA